MEQHAPKRLKTVTFQLPPAHSDDQLKLIHAWDCRFDPKAPGFDPKKPKPIVPEDAYPGFENLPLMFPGVRFVVGACGTKFGKTYGCALRLVKEAWENSGTLNWWVAPTYSQAENAYFFILGLLPKGLYQEFKGDLKIEILNPDGSHRSWIEFKSGDNPGNLRGFGVHFFVIDEAVYFNYESFVSILTTTTQTGGRGIIISTPKGRSWFYDIYQRGQVKFNLAPGQEDPWPEWMSIRLPTWSNPTVPLKFIEQAKKNVSRDIFEQEYAARFLSDSAGVFKNIRGCIKNGFDPDNPMTPEPPQDFHRYIMGVDLAKYKDFTVIIVMDVTKGRNHVVYFDRFQGEDWDVVKMRVMQTSRTYNHAKVWIDSTGLGDPIVADLMNGGANIDPDSAYKISSNTSKVQLIEKLRVGIEQGRLSYPAITPLIMELESYEYEISGHLVKFDAPSGKHDDCVIALALAWMGSDSAPFKYRFSMKRGL